MGKYVLKCINCGKIHKGVVLNCKNRCNSLLRSVYTTKRFLPGKGKNLFKFLSWLPFTNTVKTDIGAVILRPERFCNKFKLPNLYFAFNGYWPEKTAFNMTCTFKDLEALPTLLYFSENGKSKIILSSAGSTARAFAYATTLIDFDTYIVVPERMLDMVWIPAATGSKGRNHLIAVRDSSDYYGAIKISEEIAKRNGMPLEGGAKNVARRDGMGTIMLEFVEATGRLPDVYFQAVGSGTGGIAAFEASLRVLGDKTHKGVNMPALHLVQNYPFTPIYLAWEEKRDVLPERNLPFQLNNIRKIYAKVLANRNPPYSICGGVKDALIRSGGCVYSVSNSEAITAARLFEEFEGIDISPAASVCLAGLIQALNRKMIDRNSLILLNITGGGEKRIRMEYKCRRIKPEIFIDKNNLKDLDRII